MEEARALLARLERIDALERRLLSEVRALVAEGERWAEAEGAGTDAARSALARCRGILTGASARKGLAAAPEPEKEGSTMKRK